MPGYSYFEGLEEALDHMSLQHALWEASREQARQDLVVDIYGEINKLPWDVLFDDEDEDFPVFSRPSLPPVKVFLLGRFDHAWINGAGVPTMLYIGEDEGLYEYGPAHREVSDALQANPVWIRRLMIEELERWQLIEARYLLRRLWV